MIEAFPSNGEREAASALLLLSAISPSPLPKSNSIIEISHKVALGNSNSAMDSDSNSNSNSKSKSSASSILTSVNCSFTEARSQSRRMKMIAAFHEQIVKLKVTISYLQFFAAIVVRQQRSKSFFISDCRQMSSGKPAKTTTSRTTFCRSTMVSASASSSSCVSTDSVFSGITSAQSLAADRVIRGKRNSQLTKELNPNAPPSLRRRAEAILRVLSHGSISEIKIRQLIGNSPDTSKALRMLLRQGKVKRSGAGGSSDPYTYVVNLANLYHAVFLCLNLYDFILRCLKVLKSLH
ncbi:uncharacterized protein LOC125864213 [Solanum stenotomum]|uniref:uncharacterized protein LOC125864213 n=1 Tax=Solanum stenotomum TaxID=172797 RepID=UPI0020D1B662|nr:uncharacterized protein LOC125864213 [Solanum stenotomum]